MRLFALALALTCFITGPAHADGYADFAKPYLQQLAKTSVNGNTPAGLGRDPHFITINPSTWYDMEQAAVSAYSWGNDPGRFIVGGAFRAFSEGNSPIVWGFATESITAPTSPSAMVGGEILLVSRNPNASVNRWGLNIIFANRATGPGGNVESGLGANRYNDGANAVVIEAFPRSPTGEYSGWQTGIRFGKTALDRTASLPFATAIDVRDVETAPGVPWYIVTWKCGQASCGLTAHESQLEIWTAIDTPFPRLVRGL